MNQCTEGLQQIFYDVNSEMPKITFWNYWKCWHIKRREGCLTHLFPYFYIWNPVGLGSFEFPNGLKMCI